MWILDTCQTADGEWHVLEVGCMSCAGLYACDMERVAHAVSEVVRTEG